MDRKEIIILKTNKYPCWECNGLGIIEIHSPEGHWKQNCRKCGGYGKQRITITLEEYEDLKEKASMYDGLCK